MSQPDISEMEVYVDTTAKEALENYGTIRCLLQTRYTQDDRTSAAAIPWARRKATEVSRNLLQDAELGYETATFTVELKGYRLGERNYRSFICYDIFLESCSRGARHRIQKSTRQPIYLIKVMANYLFLHRAPYCDIKVALFFQMVRDNKHLDHPLYQAVMQSIGDSAENRLESIIQDVAVEIMMYIGGAFQEHLINPLHFQLYIMKAMISGSGEDVGKFMRKSINPVTEKNARLAVANTITFLLSSVRAQQRTKSFESSLEHSVVELKEEIRSKNVDDSANKDGRNDVEEDVAGWTADLRIGERK